MGIKDGRASIFCHSRSMDMFFFVDGSFGASTSIFVTKGLCSSNTLFVGLRIDIQRVFTFLILLLPSKSKQTASRLHLGEKLEQEYNVAKRSSTCMLDHLQTRKGLNNKVSTMCHIMDTHHERCMFIDKLHSNA